jgi:hypothetical protein
LPTRTMLIAEAVRRNHSWSARPGKLLSDALESGTPQNELMTSVLRVEAFLERSDRPSYDFSGRLGTLPSAEDVPSLAELARWSSPQPAEPIMATMWPVRYSAPATPLNYRSFRRTSPAALLSNARLVLHSIPTGPILGMRERPHGLAAQPSTQAQKTRRGLTRRVSSLIAA